MKWACALLLTTVNSTLLFGAVEERIIGVLEKTAKTGACAQITDVLKETYFVVKSSHAEKLCKPLLGQKVMLAGVVEERNGDTAYYFKMRNVRAYSEKEKIRKTKIEPKEETSVPLPPVRKKDPKQAPESKEKKK